MVSGLPLHGRSTIACTLSLLVSHQLGGHREVSSRGTWWEGCLSQFLSDFMSSDHGLGTWVLVAKLTLAWIIALDVRLNLGAAWRLRQLVLGCFGHSGVRLSLRLVSSHPYFGSCPVLCPMYLFCPAPEIFLLCGHHCPLRSFSFGSLHVVCRWRSSAWKCLKSPF
jgi:hypothetical protein